MKKMIVAMLSVIVLLNASWILAVSQEELKEAKSIIDAKTNCTSLSDSQLEALGEYYMEQMHPGEAHEVMHKMMGLEEGTEIEEQHHIRMAKRIYCNEAGMMSSGGMMGCGGKMGSGMMDMMMGNNMMDSGGMMGMMSGNRMAGDMMGKQAGTDMMKSRKGTYGVGYWNLFNTLFVILLIGLIMLVYLHVFKLWNSAKGSGRR